MNSGVPAQLLANRPDVQQAEFAYRYAFELTNVARTAFYPSLSITGSAGLSSLTLGNFLNPSAIAASIGAGLTQPIFNRRLNPTNLKSIFYYAAQNFSTIFLCNVLKIGELPT